MTAALSARSIGQRPHTHSTRAMRLKALLPSLLLGVALSGCAELEVTDPNRQTTGSFWQSQADATQAINATYNGLQRLGTYGRWNVFAFDIRSDIGSSSSPWPELSNFNKFSLADYDFEINIHLWRHTYETIFRANQVIENVPGISAMDAGVRNRIVGEAKFLRALLYSNLANLYGNVPLAISADASVIAPTVPIEQVWAQVEKDLREASAVLPVSYPANEAGRATKGAADAQLGKVLLQQRKWAAAEVELAKVVNSTAGYDLMPNYTDNFTQFNKNNRESVFEVQMSAFNPDLGLVGLNYGKMVGPCNVGFCDGNPTRWYFDQFFLDSTTTNQVDPRLDATIFWNKPGGMDVFGTPFATRYGAASTALYWKKWTAYYKTFQDWDEPINYTVIRFADVLLMYAEALNEQGGAKTAQAATHLNRVRARVNLRPRLTTLTQAQMRDAILHERLLELGLEQTRWLVLKRHNMLTAANLPTLRAHDSEFNFFVVGKSELLPIPQSEINLNPGAKQNPGW